ncbi:MAG: DUF2441 domain-containing protein [Clostridia bacterium]|nr:DUF2441 domain-containing protein [Clostridia bacterium]
MIAYHVVTERPMPIGATIAFDETHESGVYRRVMAREGEVREILTHPERYAAQALEHHTAVALRELAMEEVRRANYPQYPSRMRCLYVSQTLEEAERWGEYFARLGRPTYGIVELRVEGPCFVGDARNCFAGTPDWENNLRLARRYWDRAPNPDRQSPIEEVLAGGEITILKMVREIRANLEEK